MVNTTTQQAVIYARNEKGREDVLVPITLKKVKNVKFIR